MRDKGGERGEALIFSYKPSSKQAMDNVEDHPNEILRFSWGKKRGVGGVNRNIQFYESFTINDVNYSLYDCVYLYDTKVSEPYIGKLVKIWEQPDHKKKVKILWFFRPYEVQNYLEDTPLEKEIFLATGTGAGLFNINPLEAIAGKCSVICTSKDGRNRQPSSEELEMADYIFYRTFDVQSYTISEKIDDQIAGAEAKCLLNRENQQSHFGEKCNRSKGTPSTSVPSPACNLGPLVGLENRIDGKVESASTSAKKDNMMIHRPVEELPHLDKNENSKFRSAIANSEEAICHLVDHVEENMDGGSIPKSGLFDNRRPKKPRLDDTSLRKHKVESNGRGSLAHLHKESSTIGNDALAGNTSFREKKVIEAPITEKGDALVGNRIPKKKLLRASIDAINDAYSRKKKLQANGDTSKENVHLHKESSKEQNLVQPAIKPLNVSLHDNLLIGIKRKSEILEVTGRPDADRSKWFKNLPWEDRLKKADEQGTLVLVENLDSSYTSSELEDIIHRTFEKSCTARVIPQTTFQNPNYGQAYVIFKTKEAADLVVSKINNGYLQLPNGSPLLCSKGMLKVPKPSLCGHLSIDKHKLLMRERLAVSTSHCSQPNTIEYEMAMEWILHHEITFRSFRTLHKEQADELNALRGAKKSLKTKRSS